MINVKRVREENNQFSKILSEEYQQIYTDMVCYLRVSDLNDIQQEEIISDVLRMFLDWEKQGKKAKDMIGEDYKQFTDNIILAVNPQKSIIQKVKENIFIIVEAFGYMLTIDFLLLYLPRVLQGNLSMEYHYTLSMAIRGFLIFIAMIFIINYIGKNSFSLSEKSIPKFGRFLIGCCTGFYIILLIFFSKMLRSTILLSLNIGYVIALIAVFWLFKGVKKLIS